MDLKTNRKEGFCSFSVHLNCTPNLKESTRIVFKSLAFSIIWYYYTEQTEKIATDFMTCNTCRPCCITQWPYTTFTYRQLLIKYTNHQKMWTCILKVNISFFFNGQVNKHCLPLTVFIIFYYLLLAVCIFPFTTSSLGSKAFLL